MLASVLGVVAVVAIGLLIAGVLHPLIPVIVLILAGIPLVIMLTGSLFRHAAPTVDPAGGPAVPSTRQASYEPVEDPRER